MKVGEVPDEDGRRDVTHLLRHPEADISGAGDDGRVRALLQDCREIVDIGRHDDAPDLDAGTVRKPVKFVPDALAHGRQAVRRRVRPHAAHDLGGAHDRRIAGAAAEVALQGLLDLPAVGLFGRQPEAIERHDEARRAEAALRAVLVDQRLLYRMQRPCRGQVLDGYHMGGVERADEADAGIDRLIDDLAAGQPADEHGAGTAIAFRAAFLGSRQALPEPQVVEQGLSGLDGIELDQFIVQEEADRPADRWSSV